MNHEEELKYWEQYEPINNMGKYAKQTKIDNIKNKIMNPYVDINNIDRTIEIENAFTPTLEDIKLDPEFYAELVNDLMYHWVYGTRETQMMVLAKKNMLIGAGAPVEEGSKMLAIEDLEGKTEDQIKQHLARGYSDSGYTDYEYIKEKLEKLDVLIAYESVGSWGCDSTSFFLFRSKETGELYEMHGSHCSCYGFEGQFRLEPTTKAALMSRVESARSRNKEEGDEHTIFSLGGYDGDATNNAKAVNNYITNL